MRFLAFARDYQAQLFPAILQALNPSLIVYLVVNHRERQQLEEVGAKHIVVLSDELKKNSDFYNTLEEGLFGDFPYNPIMCDRYLRVLDVKMQMRLANGIYEVLKKLYVKHGFTHVFNEDVALFPSQVLFYFARKYNAKTMFWMPSYVPGLFGILDTMGNGKFRSPSRPQMTEDEAFQLSRDHIVKVQNDQGHPIYSQSYLTRTSRVVQTRQAVLEYLRYCKHKVIAPTVWEDYIAHSNWRTLHWYSQCKMGILKAEYDSTSEIATCDFIYPIHFEPEATLFYWSPQFYSQLAFLEQLVNALPPGSCLWLKEHPQQKGVLGTKAWKALRARLPTLRFLPGHLSIRSLIPHFRAMVTLASTAGQDALVLGKPVFVFGHPTYMNYPGSSVCSSIHDFARRQREHLGSFEFREEALLHAIAADTRRQVKGYPFPNPHLHSRDSLSELSVGLRLFL